MLASGLAFRPPERTTRFNAARLSQFIRGLGRSLDWSEVDRFIDSGLRALVVENLRLLRAKGVIVQRASKAHVEPRGRT